MEFSPVYQDPAYLSWLLTWSGYTQGFELWPLLRPLVHLHPRVREWNILPLRWWPGIPLYSERYAKVSTSCNLSLACPFMAWLPPSCLVSTSGRGVSGPGAEAPADSGFLWPSQASRSSTHQRRRLSVFRSPVLSTSDLTGGRSVLLCHPDPYTESFQWFYQRSSGFTVKIFFRHIANEGR